MKFFICRFMFSEVHFSRLFRAKEIRKLSKISFQEGLVEKFIQTIKWCFSFFDRSGASNTERKLELFNSRRKFLRRV